VYRPKAFDVDDIATIHDLIDACGPAQVVSLNAGRLAVSMVPLILDRSAGECGRLIGHLARPNPHWRDVDPSVEAVAIFVGPDAYVSPSLYPSKRETGKVVPTWNYVTVNAHGPLLVHDDKEFVRDVVERLTTRHEARRADPWAIADAPADYIDAMLGGIVGIEIPITRLEGKKKLSQNRPVEDVHAVIAGLRSGTPTEQAVAELMSDA
jgi:transcriptional regulator